MEFFNKTTNSNGNNELYELWFRLAYKKLIRNKKMTAAIRPGIRKCPGPKCTNENEIAKIRVLLKPGDESKDIMPIFDNFETMVEIEKIIVKPLKDLKAEDLKNCSPDCQTPELAQYHLALIYNQEFKGEDIISIINFKYL